MDNRLIRNIQARHSGDLQRKPGNCPHITGVASAAKSTTEGAEYPHKAAGELARLASTMQTLVQQFDLGTDEHQQQGTPSAVQTKKKVAQRPLVTGSAKRQATHSIQ